MIILNTQNFTMQHRAREQTQTCMYLRLVLVLSS